MRRMVQLLLQQLLLLLRRRGRGLLLSGRGRALGSGGCGHWHWRICAPCLRIKFPLRQPLCSTDAPFLTVTHENEDSPSPGDSPPNK